MSNLVTQERNHYRDRIRELETAIEQKTNSTFSSLLDSNYIPTLFNCLSFFGSID